MCYTCQCSVVVVCKQVTQEMLETSKSDFIQLKTEHEYLFIYLFIYLLLLCVISAK